MMMHGPRAHIRVSNESDKNDLVRDGVKYLCERFLNKEDSTEMCTEGFDTFT
jgi:hypothetical protein